MLARVIDFEDLQRQTSETTVHYERRYRVVVIGLTTEESLRSGLSESGNDILVPATRRDEQGQLRPAEPCPVAKESLIRVSTPQRLSYDVGAKVVLGRLTVRLLPNNRKSFTALGVWPAPDQ